MKPIELQMKAFGPFCDLQTLNLNSLKDSGLFLISGNTGVGKTTILDAISYALYGKVSGSRKNPATLKCDQARPNDTCYVKLRFESDSKIYVVKRSPKQTKASGAVMESQAELIMPDGTIITKIKEADRLIEDEILNINQENFDKLIMLPQGRFQKLLLEKGKEQTETFRMLFQTEIYQKITDALSKHKKGLDEQYASIFERNKQTVAKLIIPSCKFTDDDINDPKLSNVIRQTELQIEQDRNNRAKIKSQTDALQNQMKKIAVNLNLAGEYDRRKANLNANQNLLDKLLSNEKELAESEKRYEFIPVIEKLNILEENQNKTKTNLDYINNKTDCLKKEKKLYELKYNSLEKTGKDINLKKERLENISAELSKLNRVADNLLKIESIRNDSKKHKARIEVLQAKEKRLKTLNEMREVKQSGIKEREIIKCMDGAAQICKDLKINRQKREEAYLVYLKACEQFYENAATHLKERIEDGKPCPVCGSICHIDSSVAAHSEIKEDFLTELNELRTTFEQYKDKENKNVTDLNLNAEKLKHLNVDLNVNESDLENLSGIHKQKLKELQIEYLNLKSKLNGNCNDNEIIAEHLQELEQTRQEIIKTNTILDESDKNIDLIISDISQNLRGKAQVDDKIKKYSEEQTKLSEDIKLYENEFAKTKEKLNVISGNLNFSVSEQKKRQQEYIKAKSDFEDQLASQNINFKEYREYLKNISQIKTDGENAKKIRLKIQNLTASIAALKEYMKNPPPLKEDLINRKNLIENEMNELKIKEETLNKRYNTNSLFYNELTESLEKLKSIDSKSSSAKHLFDIAKGGQKRMGLEQFVLSYYLDEVLAYANIRYAQMSQNRYNIIRNTDPQKNGMELNVFDLHNAKIRDITTLSGGETFIASLALSLGLADAVSNRTGGVTLGTMFIDEGFGTLDSNYLDCVIDCLNKLKQKGRLIGIISHVAELKNRIPSQIIVKRTNNPSQSTVEIVNN